MINSIPTIRTIMALRGEKLIIDLGKTFTGTLTAWMKKDPNDKTYRSFSILSNRYLVLSQDRAKDYYDINDILLESIEGKWFFDVEQLDTGGTVGVDEKTVFTGTIQFINDITGSDGIETIPSPIIDNILRLVDTPSVYGTTTQILQMNAGGTALEWADASGGVSSLPDLADVVSATNTNKFVLVANGSTGYVGRALVEADISDLQSYLTVESDTLQDVTGRGSTTDQNIQVPSLSFNTASVVDVIQGQLAWNADEETLDLGLNGAVLQLGQEVHYHVKNSSGEDISDGDAIMAVGTLGASGRILVAKMVNDGTVEPYFFLGIATEAIGNDTEGKITHFGKVRGIQTDGDNYSETWLDGDLLYINSTIAGRLTNVEPQAPSHKSPIAIVLDAHASNGTISVRVSLNQGIHESHDVQISSSLNNDFLKYNLSLKRWENGQLVEADISDFGSYLTSETSHADVLVDGDFATAGLMKTDGAGNYSILTDNSSNWNTAYTHSQLVVGNPHAVTKAEVGLGNVPNIDTTNASNITTGTLPSSVIPPVALTSVQTANSEVNMLLLTTEEGDVVVRTDQPSKSWMHNGGIAGTMADFTELQTPTDSVLSVNSQTGTVVLTTTHINEGTNLYYTEGRVSANTSVAANTAKTSFPGFTSLITDYGFTDNSGNWNTAHGWGDHSGLYSVLAHTHTFASLTSKPTTLSGYGISDSKANFNSALSDGTFLYVGDVTTFPGWGSITDHTDIVSATNTDKFVLVANGSTGYVGRALVEADISDLGSYLATGITTLSGYGISDSKANFNSALSDGTFLYVGDVTSNIPVATDVIWDAAGDLVVGTGADSAAKLAKGTALQQLRVNAGATALEWADAEGGGGANSADFELTATATAGDIVQLLSNGKMEPIAGTTSNLGSSFSFPDSEENGLKVDMDPFNANKFIAAWIDVDSDTRIAVGTITGQTITLGTPIDVPSPWTSIASLDIRWNPNVENEFAIVGREIFDELNVIGGTVSGTVPSISSNYNYAGSIDGICMDWVDDSHIVVIYKEGLDMTAKAFVIDGTNLPTLAATDGNVGGGLDFGNSTKAKMRTNPNTPGEFVMAFVDQSNSDIYALSGLFTAPSTLVAQDSAITLKGGTCDYPDISWHPTKTDTFLVSYDDGTSGYVLPCTISGGTITKYSEVVFFSSDSPSWNKIEHDPNDPDSFLIAYSYYDGTARQEMRLGTWTTDTVVTVAGSPLFTHEPSDTGYVSISYDKVLTTSKFIIAGSTSVGEAAVATYAGNNIDINARKGILQVSGVATDVREVLLSGIDETQTGMTIGTTYFVVDDGTLSPTPTSPIVPIGKAISATQLVVEQHPDGVQISDLHASLKDEFSISGTEIDWNRGITGFKTLGAAWSPTFANPVVGKTMMIVTTGNYTITWPTGVDAATDFADYDGTKRNVHIITCVSTSLPLYAGSVKAYTI